MQYPGHKGQHRFSFPILVLKPNFSDIAVVSVLHGFSVSEKSDEYFGHCGLHFGEDKCNY
jgi:hypothetical protein